MEKSLIVSVAVLVIINITETVTNSIVSPSLIFYVEEMGGTKEQYGVIMSAFYLTSLFVLTYYGAWVDSNGNKYLAPYTASFVLGIIGSLVYFLAAIFPQGSLAVGMILLARLFQGISASGRTLAYSWVATAIPKKQQRMPLTVTSLARVFGLGAGPLLNLLVTEVNTEWVISSKLGIVMPINQNNSIGLIMAFSQMILLVVTRLFLKDPPYRGDRAAPGDVKPKRAGWKEIWGCLANFELLFCPLNFIALMSNFQFYSVSIAPVGSHAFGWTPVQISYVMAAQAVMLFAGSCASIMISMTKAPEVLILGFGNLCFVAGGSMTYYWWSADSTPLRFIVPIMIVSFAFPLIIPANRSKYTKAVQSCPGLEGSIGVMQGFLTQSLMLGGLVGPNLGAALGIRSPEEIDVSDSSRELSPWAWYIPISSMVMVIGLIFEEVLLGTNELGLCKGGGEEYASGPEEAPVNETSKLLSEDEGVRTRRRRSSVDEINEKFEP